MRPRVLLNMASSLDGKIAPAHEHGPFVMSRYAEDPSRMRGLRARADAVVIGATNLRVDDPDLMPSALRVVVTTLADGIEPAARMFGAALGGEAVVAHAAVMPESKRRSLAPVATMVELGHEGVDTVRLLEWLAVERKCKTVLCEGGGGLAADLFAARAVDAMYVTIVPRILGGRAAPTMVSGEGFAPGTVPDGRLVSCEQVGDELFLEYEFAWPESSPRSA
jgi:riboflavin-specific deaminase-like protein